MKQELAEASLKATAFKQSLKGRVLSIKLSDSSNAPEPNLTAYTPRRWSRRARRGACSPNGSPSGSPYFGPGPELDYHCED